MLEPCPLPLAYLNHGLFRRAYFAGPFVAGFFHLQHKIQETLRHYYTIRRSLTHLVDLEQLTIDTLYDHKRLHHLCWLTSLF